MYIKGNFSKKKLKGKTKEEKAEQSKYNEYIKKALGKHYRDSSFLKLTKASLTLKQLKFGTIESHRLLSVQIGLDIIELKSSWIEFLLIMLSDIIEESKEDLKSTLCKSNITNSSFCVDTMYGNYSLGNRRYTVYKIYDTGYYLEAVMTPENIFMAMVHMIKYLDINIQEIRFNIEIHNKKEVKEREHKEQVDTGKILEVNIGDAYRLFEENRFLKGIKLLDKVYDIHSVEVALLTFCYEVYIKYGIDKILHLDNNDETGICVSELTAPYPCARIGDSLALVYTSNNIESILQFIEDAMDKLEMKDSDLLFEFRGNSEIKHEWEVD